MTWQFIHLDDVAPMPWRNGGGVTRELIAWPVGSDWDWRISVAEIEKDGPFSRYEGVQRWFAVLGGAGVRLTLDGQSQELGPRSAAVCFDGAAAPECTLLDGPTEDLNLMLRQGRAQARMQRVSASFAERVPAGRVIAVYTREERTTVEVDSDIIEMPSHALAWRVLAEPASVQIWSETAMWMEIWK
jgi:uncharacterized protein